MLGVEVAGQRALLDLGLALREGLAHLEGHRAGVLALPARSTLAAARSSAARSATAAAARCAERGARGDGAR